MLSGRRLRLLAEFLLLFVVLPIAYWAIRWPRFIFLPLWAATALCLIVLLRDRSFDNRKLWNARAVPRHIRPVLLRFVIAGPILAGAAYCLTPEYWLSFVRNAPVFWAIVMVAYPILSVYPQGVLHRVFLLHRYRSLFPGEWAAATVSALMFSLMHLGFPEPTVAMSLTAVGGLIFARTYQKSGSALLASIEHAMYGCLIFTIGWGRFFYHGAIAAH
jgi:membrane protease YdiL (CAAX protease family)